MKTIGLIGGMSRESSIEYYRIINQQVKQHLGGLHSAKSLMYSVDFQEIETLQHHGQRDQATTIMINAAQRLERGGADFVVICTNTMHKMANDVQQAISIPLLHIANATATTVINEGIHKIGLLGTKFTMEEDFYKGRLVDKHHLEVITPDESDRNTIHRIIYDELCQGIINQQSKQEYLNIIYKLQQQGVGGVILGCTEIGLLVQQSDVDLPLFDTTQIHAEEAVKFALH